jgi:glycosyltransferase involved in cell wall biosynthesis
MRASKPVIATDTGGLSEAVENGRNGILVKPGDIDELATAIERLLTDKELCVRMGTEGRKAFLEKFLLQDKIKLHEEIYKNLLSQA